MTEEAQPPGVERAADETPGQPAEHEPRYHEPSYTLPAEDAALPTSAPGRPAGPVSEWSRPAPAGSEAGPGLAGTGWSAASTAPIPVTPTSGPSPSTPPTPATVAWGSGQDSGPVPATPTSDPGLPTSTSGPGPGSTPGVSTPMAGAAPGTPTSGPGPAGAPGAAGVVGYVVAEPVRAATSGGAPTAYPGMPGLAGGPGADGAQFAAVPAPPRESLRAPSRVDAVPGTPFGLVHLEVAPVTSGPAVASLVTGVGSVLVALVAGCLGLVGSSPQDWGGWVAGAFAVLAGLLGVAGVLLGELGRRQTSPAGGALWPGRRRAAGAAVPGPTAPPVRFTGRGLAIAGLSCAGVGLALTVLALAVAVLLQLV
ncbi:hypothetical protein GCM10022225_46260 [Plantactinospora mayteni]|uniref:Uncharacterized protein n=1 Tax=Plantactinospora mayteni TaxID=566021 RepID=A0ABQ4EXA0_9ACTN|nr:hypothetical protein [Plantactinospora mayteni]GIG99295.1 hypothetical protein Pma05_58680 [Plantactinospora mayteni]